MTFILRPRFLYKSFVCLTRSHALNESVDTARYLLSDSFSKTGSIKTFHGLWVYLESNHVIFDPASVDIHDGHQHWMQLYCPARIISAVFAYLALLFHTSSLSFPSEILSSESLLSSFATLIFLYFPSYLYFLAQGKFSIPLLTVFVWLDLFVNSTKPELAHRKGRKHYSFISKFN